MTEKSFITVMSSSETHSWFLVIPFSIMMEKGTMRNQPWVTDNEVMLKEIKLKVKHIIAILTKKSKQMDGPIDLTHWFTSILIFLHNLPKKSFMEIHTKRLLWTRIRKVFSTPPPPQKMKMIKYYGSSKDMYLSILWSLKLVQQLST